MILDRRMFLLGMGASLVVPRLARAFGPTSQVDIAEIDLGAGTISRPDAWERLLLEVSSTTSIETNPKPVKVDPASEELFKHPFSVLEGSGAFDLPDERGLEQLSRYLDYGGFLLIDETSGSESSEFDKSVRRLCEVLFPTRPLAPLPSDHSIYRAFFMIERPMGRLARFPYLEGITAGGRDGEGGHTPLVYSRNDISGALDRGADGRHRNTCQPGGETQRREAVKLGINLVEYCLTSDYKKDQAHVKKLIEEGRLDADWEIE
jgi:hypothetical protein